MAPRIAFTIAALGLSALCAFGQSSGANFVSPGAYNGSWTTTMQFNTTVIVGAPYSAEQVNETVQTLADGTHITRQGALVRMWRDSQGRTRTERQMSGPPNTPKVPVMVEIRDPMGGYGYMLDTQGKVAHRIKLQPTPASAARMATQAAQSRTAQASPPDPNGPVFTTEDLGTQVTEGLMAQGTRSTTTYPVGSQGNDRPLVSVFENWYSPDLKLQVLSKSSDPRQGDTTTKLTNVSRSEPDPMLFMPPADYSVVDETGPQVTIHYGQQ